MTANVLVKDLTTPAVPYIIGQSGTASTCPADATEDTLATVTIPGGTIGANGSLRITQLWSYTNSVNAKNLRVRLGGASGTIMQDITATTTDQNRRVFEIFNSNSQSSQKCFLKTVAAGVGSAATAITTASIDTSTDQDLVFTGQKASSGETLTLEGYIVEILHKS